MSAFYITAHARRRYMDRIRPGADDREAFLVLKDASRRAVRGGRTFRGHVIWIVDQPAMRLVTKHDHVHGMICVTVLGPEETWEEEVAEAPPAADPPPARPEPPPPPAAPAPPRPTREERRAQAWAHAVRGATSPAASRQSEEQAAAAARRKARAEAHAARVAAEASAKRARMEAEGPLKAVRRAVHEAGFRQNRALGLPTSSQRRAMAAAAGAPPTCGSYKTEGCRNLLDGYVSVWRRAHDGAGLCRGCDAEMDVAFGELGARGREQGIAAE